MAHFFSALQGKQVDNVKELDEKASNGSTALFKFEGLKERPSKGPLGLCRGLMRVYMGYIRVILTSVHSRLFWRHAKNWRLPIGSADGSA